MFWVKEDPSVGRSHVSHGRFAGARPTTWFQPSLRVVPTREIGEMVSFVDFRLGQVGIVAA